VLGSPVPGRNTWNTSVPGPNGWIPPGICRGSPACRAASAGPAPSTCPPRNPAAPSPAPAARNRRRLGPCRCPGSRARTVTADECGRSIATPLCTMPCPSHPTPLPAARRPVTPAPLRPTGHPMPSHRHTAVPLVSTTGRPAGRPGQRRLPWPQVLRSRGRRREQEADGQVTIGANAAGWDAPRQRARRCGRHGSRHLDSRCLTALSGRAVAIRMSGTPPGPPSAVPGHAEAARQEDHDGTTLAGITGRPACLQAAKPPSISVALRRPSRCNIAAARLD
jgi:hypothetical protein